MESIPVWGHAAIVLATFFAIAVGAKYVVDAAAVLAERMGISPLVIGLTVVAFGTSAPEFGVTLVAAFGGRDSISVGNIVGSNIFNLGFILGGAAAVRAIPTDRILVWRDAVSLVAATVVLYLLVGLDLRLGAVDGAILFLLLLAYLFAVWSARKRGVEPVADELEEVGALPWHDSVPAQAGFLLAGFVLVALASHFLIESASALALHFGVSEWVIAVTVVAAGTSVPELATVLAGVVRGHLAMSAGNVIGSDIFNVLGVLGLAGMLQPMGLAPEARASLLALTGMVAVVLLSMRSGWRVSRLEGLLLLGLALLRWVLDFASRAG
jgi:cation:H+ antiporter